MPPAPPYIFKTLFCPPLQECLDETLVCVCAHHLDYLLGGSRIVVNIKQTKQQAFQLLKGTDWYIVRMLELGYDEAPVPADITAFRATTRTASTERCAAIEATTTVEELATLLEAPSTVYNAETDTTSDNPDALPQYPEQPEEGVYY